jgi:Na+-driven multidrug efflux pump
MRHVVVMAGTGAIGLIAVFVVDLINLFYISLLGQRPIAAAVGFAGTVGFFQTSLCIGMTIGVGAVVSRLVGAARMDEARLVATSSLTIMAVLSAAVGVGTVLALGPILSALAAAGETQALAAGYLRLTSLSVPLLAVGMCCSALLRCVGDAKRAMNVTLLAAFATAVLDPLLIFGLHLGLMGAAISTILSRIVLAGLGGHWVRGHGLLGRVAVARIPADTALVFAVAGPAILTNMATPVGAAFVTRSMALFGAGAVAGQATVDRITPVAFGVVYALTGAVGPIIAQNLGAGRFERIRETLRDSLIFVIAAVCGAWLVLAAGQSYIVLAFSAEGVTAELIRLFCTVTCAGFLFTGSLFVANAAFNNLGYPLLATLFNWGRATLGTIPFVAYGAGYGPAGVMVGQAAGSLLFGIAAAAVAFRVAGRLGGGRAPVAAHSVALAGTTGHAALAGLASRPGEH